MEILSLCILKKLRDCDYLQTSYKQLNFWEVVHFERNPKEVDIVIASPVVFI